ncbi:DUF2945 domain-containing protein [Candidatus Gracilibacteria bacterium]|nr:DUF2945 domain-containing protein [Candidatus Gracilibacteria bacterium]
MKNLQKGEYVNWMRHDNEKMRGRIVDVFIEEFTRTIEGQEFHRNPTIDAPAYLIEQDSGEEFILSHNELVEADDQDDHSDDNPHVRMKDKKHTY